VCVCVCVCECVFVCVCVMCDLVVLNVCFCCPLYAPCRYSKVVSVVGVNAACECCINPVYIRFPWQGRSPHIYKVMYGVFIYGSGQP